jgi:hypothetical protein
VASPSTSAEVFEHHQKAVQRRGLIGQVQPQQVRQLADGNHHRRAEGEAQHHRVRNEIHQGAKAQQSEQPLENAGEQCQKQDQGDVVF